MSEALSGMRLDSEMKMTAGELEFLAEDELVEIVPRFTFVEINLLGGTYGPFQPMVPTKVPLWLAIQLVQRNLGTVRPPEWLHEDNMEELWRKEDRSREKNVLEEVPFHYQEISTLLLRHCPESFAGSEANVRLKLKDIEDLRESKLQTSLRVLEDDHAAINISNIAAMEMNRIRPFLINALHRFRDLKRAELQVTQGSQNMSQQYMDNSGL